MAGEAAHHAQSLGAPDRVLAGLQRRPVQRQVGRELPCTRPFGVADEAGQQVSFRDKLEAEGAADRQVVLGRLMQRAHRELPGQGRARVRSAVRSTRA